MWGVKKERAAIIQHVATSINIFCSMSFPHCYYYYFFLALLLLEIRRSMYNVPMKPSALRWRWERSKGLVLKIDRSEKRTEEMRADQPRVLREGERERELEKLVLWSCDKCRPPTAWPFIFQHHSSSVRSLADLTVWPKSLTISPGGLLLLNKQWHRLKYSNRISTQAFTPPDILD